MTTNDQSTIWLKHADPYVKASIVITRVMNLGHFRNDKGPFSTSWAKAGHEIESEAGVCKIDESV